MRTTFYDYDHFMKMGSSLMVAMIVIDDDYEVAGYDLPPHLLEFDLGGSLVIDNNMAVLGGSEIKSSGSRMFL